MTSPVAPEYAPRWRIPRSAAMLSAVSVARIAAAMPTSTNVNPRSLRMPRCVATEMPRATPRNDEGNAGATDGNGHYGVAGRYKLRGGNELGCRCRADSLLARSLVDTVALDGAHRRDEDPLTDCMLR